MLPTVALLNKVRALHAQGINMVGEVEEEDEFLKMNESVIHVFDIDIEKILDQYKNQEQSKETKQGKDKEEELLEQEDLNEDIFDTD